jgi:hypothetical protein
MIETVTVEVRIRVGNLYVSETRAASVSMLASLPIPEKWFQHEIQYLSEHTVERAIEELRTKELIPK